MSKVSIYRFRNRKETVSAIEYKDNFEGEEHYGRTSLEVLFESKTIEFIGPSTNDRKKIIEYLEKTDGGKILDIDCEIKQSLDRYQIYYQLKLFQEKYNCVEEFGSSVVSYGAALVLHKIIPTTKDIDLIVHRNMSYDLEDKFGIHRYLAPMGDTSIQHITDMDIDCFIGDISNSIRLSKEYGIRSIPALVMEYRERGRQKDSDKIELIKNKIEENSNGYRVYN